MEGSSESPTHINIFFINKLELGMCNGVVKFEDNTNIFKTVKTKADCAEL